MLKIKLVSGKPEFEPRESGSRACPLLLDITLPLRSNSQKAVSMNSLSPNHLLYQEGYGETEQLMFGKWKLNNKMCTVEWGFPAGPGEH